VCSDGVLDGELVQLELGRDGPDLVDIRPVEADPGRAVSLAQQFEGLLQTAGVRAAPSIDVDRIVDERHDGPRPQVDEMEHGRDTTLC
jgi:hypothetical protein